MRAILLLVVMTSGAALAQDAFEIAVYGSETAVPGQLGAELHLNHVLVGRTTGREGALPTEHVTHLTLEPHVGLATWCEAGAYLSTALRADGHYDYAGIKLRFKARLPWKVGEVLGFALNQELSATPATYEAGQFAWELRPVVDLDWKRLYVSVNPIVSVPMLGGLPDFEPSAKASVRVLDQLTVGAEYYAALGTIGRPQPPSAQSHRLFGTVDLDWQRGRALYELNVGVGYDFTGPEKWIVKAIVAFDLLPEPARP